MAKLATISKKDALTAISMEIADTKNHLAESKATGEATKETNADYKGFIDGLKAAKAIIKALPTV